MKIKANYEQLKEFLKNGASCLSLSFKQVEMIIGEKIPSVYINRKTINWKNSRIRMAAEKAGFYLQEVDYDNHWILFAKTESIIVNGEEKTTRVNIDGY